MKHYIDGNLCSSAYHSIDRNDNGELFCSNSQIKKFAEDQQDFKYGLGFQGSTAAKLGSYLDAKLLDPDELKLFKSAKDNPHLSADGGCRSKVAKEWKAEQEKLGIQFITDSEEREIQNNLTCIQYDASAQELLNNSKKQVALFSEIQGVPFKGLIDILPDKGSYFGDSICDLKRTSKFLPKEFRRHVRNMKYTWQAYLYLKLYNQIQEFTGGNDFRSKWYFLVASSKAPFGCGVAELSQDLIQEAGKELELAVGYWKEAQKTGKFLNPYQLGDEILVLD